MAAEPKTIDVIPGSDLAKLLDEAANEPLILAKDGERFRLQREEEDIWAGYDPEVSRQGILAAAGSWKGLVDVEAFKAYIRERRRTKNRPSVRW